MWECFFYKYLGIYCPGCGGTRMIKALFRLDFYQAFRYNPFIFCCLIFGIIYLVINIILKLLGKKLIIPKERDFIIFTILIISYFLIRNIPLFDFLIPTEV